MECATEISYHERNLQVCNNENMNYMYMVKYKEEQLFAPK